MRRTTSILVRLLALASFAFYCSLYGDLFTFTFGVCCWAVTEGGLWIAAHPGLYCWLDDHVPHARPDGSLVCQRCDAALAPAPEHDQGPLYWCQDCNRATLSARGRCFRCASRSITLVRTRRPAP
jgi:hypothetical protein